MIRTEKIKRQMRSAGITQEQLANRLGIDPSTLNRKINNADGCKISVREANEIASILNFRKDELTDIFFAEELA